MIRAPRICGVMAGLMLLAGCSTPVDSEVAEGETTNASATDEALTQIEPSPEVQDLLPDEVRESGEITIVGTQGSPPTSYSDENGQPSGLNPDLARAMAQIMGLDPDIPLTTTDALVPGLQSGRYDMAVASLSPSAERLEVLDMVAFTKGGSAIAVPEGNPDALSSKELCGLRVGVAQGSFQSTDRLPALNEQECATQGDPDIEAVTLPDQAQTLLALSNNRADAVMADGPVLAYAQLQQEGEFDILEDDSNLLSTGGMATPKESELLPAIEEAMRVLHSSPTYEEIYDKWGMSDYVLPEDEMGILDAND